MYYVFNEAGKAGLSQHLPVKIDNLVGSKERQAKAKEGLVFSLLPFFMRKAACSTQNQTGESILTIYK